MASDGQAPGLKVTGANMIVGYARVSTTDQSLVIQQEELSAQGCERIFQDQASAIADELGCHRQSVYRLMEQ
jgi:DNA invertase Pin-like site-specific DNA recombinase